MHSFTERHYGSSVLYCRLMLMLPEEATVHKKCILTGFDDVRGMMTDAC